MPTSKLSISLPDTLVSFIDEKVNVAGYGSVSEYFRELVRRDRRETYERVAQLGPKTSQSSDQVRQTHDLWRGFRDPTKTR